MAVMYTHSTCVERCVLSEKKNRTQSESIFLINFMVLCGISTAMQMCYYVAVKMRIPFMTYFVEVAYVHVLCAVHHLSAPWPIFIVAIDA